MTRKALARHAKVSERYLAQLEAGLGNGSIVLLRRISRAIGVPLAQLLQEGSEPALDLVLLSQFLERLPPTGLAEARDLVLNHFAEPSHDDRRRRIALIGLRGSGKSTLGRLLAEASMCPSSSSTARSSGAVARHLSEIFDMFGQETSAAPSARRSTTYCAHNGFVIATTGTSSPSPPLWNACSLLPHRVGEGRAGRTHEACDGSRATCGRWATARARWKT